MSSPKITRIFGFFAPAACASVVPMPPTRRLETASAPSATFRTPAPKSILFPFQVILVSCRGRDLPLRIVQFATMAAVGELSVLTADLRIPLHPERREVCRRSGTLDALQDVLHVGIDVLPEPLQA